ncbi:MAG: GNAT family N-acetyltransferase [Ruminococcaceae bacterium]|nr:GNAT family N-acetyltransferase [Oscillospiraceae bacterium]
MNLRLASEKDLPEISRLFSAITKKLDSENIRIWDEIYPDCAFPEDIKRKSLFILEKEDKLISAFALCEPMEDEGSIVWENPDAKGAYLFRFGVSPDCLNKGIGAYMLKEAEKIAKESGGEYLRLLVVDYNTPAICFYEKNGYRKAEGIYIKDQDGLILREYGYEKRL